MNDDEVILWNEFMIQCWLILLVLSLSGYILQFYVGEGYREKLLEFVNVCIFFYRNNGLLSKYDIFLDLEKYKRGNFFLKFLGKICVIRKNIVVSDIGYNRVLVLFKDGVVQVFWIIIYSFIFFLYN